ncbi:MAG: ArsR/SmtB family transcription factor [Spongiibacteraceae bacterium]
MTASANTIASITDDELAQAFKALANPYRLSIYREILRQQRDQIGPDDDSGCLIFDFINKLDIGAPTISHHVKALVKANLIRVERNSKYISCYLNEGMRDALVESLSLTP